MDSGESAGVEREVISQWMGKIKIFTTEVTEGTQRVSQSWMGLDEESFGDPSRNRPRLLGMTSGVIGMTRGRFGRAREGKYFFLEQLGCEIRKRLW